MKKLKNPIYGRIQTRMVAGIEQYGWEEAEKFGFSGTPGYILNGVPIRGAYPTQYFVQIVDKLTKKGKLKL